jgi:hypothetical protein
LEIFGKCLFDLNPSAEISDELMKNYDEEFVKCKT